MKKRILKVSGIILLTAIFAVTLFFSYVLFVINSSKPIGSRLVVDKVNMTITVNDDKDIKVLQLSDTQITALGDAVKTMPIIKEVVEKAKPDLIVLAGDNFMTDSPKWMLKQYIKFFDQFEIPWAPVMGNHDYTTQVPVQEQCKYFENSKYCLFKQGPIKNSYGNYCYTIQRNGNDIYSLIFMDNAVDFGQDHLLWYQNTINDITTKNNGNVIPSWVIFHRPIVETYYAYYLSGEKEIDGEKREGVAYVREDDGSIFDLAYNLCSTTAFMYGHNHRNSYICTYKGIKLCFGLKTGPTCYYDTDLMGGNLYTIKADNTFDIERIFVT